MKRCFVLLSFVLFLVSVFLGCSRVPSAPEKQQVVISEKLAQEPPNQEKKVEEKKVPEEVIEKLKASIAIHNNKDVRKFPYPYKAMVAISSDIDNTTLEEFEKYHKFLNTKERTEFGEGLGLDIGDTMWVFTGSNVPEITDLKGHGQEAVMTYYKGTDSKVIHDGEKIKRYYKAGWIDALHTYGDFSRLQGEDISFRREYAEKAWETLNKENMKFKVWINHGNQSNKQNFGANNIGKYFHYQEGDNAKSPYYNTDLVIKNGIKFLWNSDCKADFEVDNPLFPINLRDGKRIWGFHRYTYDMIKGTADWTWTPENVYKQITKERLNKLVKDQGYSIIAQHLGVNGEKLFIAKNIEALRLLKEYKENGQILVARTSRLLNYALYQQYVKYSLVNFQDKLWINIDSIADPIFGEFKPELEDLAGLTFYTDNPEKTCILLNLKPVDDKYIQRNPKEDNCLRSIGFKWYKENYHDYTQMEKNFSNIDEIH